MLRAVPRRNVLLHYWGKKEGSEERREIGRREGKGMKGGKEGAGGKKGIV